MPFTTLRTNKLKHVRPFIPVFVAALLSWCSVARCQSWNYWGQIGVTYQHGNANNRLATDGTNLFYSTMLDGVWRTSLHDGQFSQMPLTGFPIWDANTNTNGYAVWNIHCAPGGTLLISGSPVNVTSNVVSAPPSSFNNTLPVFYWWDETNQLWHPSAVTNKTYPYTSKVGNFCNAFDGSVWTCFGFAPYAYRSTDDGHSFTAFNVDARVPTNYFPIPGNAGLSTVGNLFSIVAGLNNDVVVGTETAGFMYTTNNGLNWTSLDANFTDTNSPNPLGRIGNAIVTGTDHFGDFLCANFESVAYPGHTNWDGVKLIGWRPRDGSYFNAAAGFPPNWGPTEVITPRSGTSFVFMNQDYTLKGGIYMSPNGRSWTQLNQGSGADMPFAVTNAMTAGRAIAAVGNLVYVVYGGAVSVFDSTPAPILNRPPVAFSQAINLVENVGANLTLGGKDPDSDTLKFTIVTPPTRGTLSGTPPDLTYTPNNNSFGLDEFSFVVDDGAYTSAVAIVNLAINPPTNPPPTITFSTSVPNGGWCVNPTNIVLSATASDSDGGLRVNFYDGLTLVATQSNAPFAVTITNASIGDHTFFARAADKFSARTWALPSVVTVLPVNPQIQVRDVDAANVAVSWPLELGGYFLETATDVVGPWTLSPFPPEYFMNQTVTLPKADAQFFRLAHGH